MGSIAKGTCTFRGCDKPLLAKGLCTGHLKQLQRRGTVDLLTPLRAGPARGQITVRLRQDILAALGDSPSERAREIIEAWGDAELRREARGA